jgi:hypothetical protein
LVLRRAWCSLQSLHSAWASHIRSAVRLQLADEMRNLKFGMRQAECNIYYFRKDHFRPCGNYRTSDVHEVTLHTFHSVTSKPIQIRRTSRKQFHCQNAAEKLWTARCATVFATGSSTSHLPSMKLSPANAFQLREDP